MPLPLVSQPGTVYLLRHTRVDAPGLCYGYHDVPLAATFAAEWAAVQAKLPAPGATPSHLVSSPATRCQQLAEALAHGTGFTTDERLREMHFGAWEGRPWDQLPPAELTPWMADFATLAPPTGETFSQLQARAAAFLTTLETQAGATVVVTHGGVVRALLCHCLEMPLRNAFQFNIDFGSLTVLRRQHGRWAVDLVNA